MLLLVPCAWAAKVGPLDGAAGPSLPAVGMPSLVAESELFNPSLPLQLEKLGLNEAALLEWARLLNDAHGADRKMVLEKLVLLSLREGHTYAADSWLAELQEAYPDEQESLEMLLIRYEKADASQKNTVLARLTEAYPAQEASLDVRRADVLRQAVQNGAIANTWGVMDVSAIEAVLTEQKAAGGVRVMVAIGLGVVPGLGYAYLGAFGEAAMLLLGWCVLGWAFAAACRHRHYAYALVFALPWVALWMNAPMAAGAMAEAQAQTLRVDALQQAFPAWANSLHGAASSAK